MTEKEKLDREELLKGIREHEDLMKQLDELTKDSPLDKLEKLDGILGGKDGDILLDEDEEEEEDEDYLDEEEEDDDDFLDDEDDEDFLDDLEQIDGDEDYLEHDFRRHFKGKDAKEIVESIVKDLKEGRVFFHEGKPIDFDGIDNEKLEKAVEEIMAGGGKKKESVK